MAKRRVVNRGYRPIRNANLIGRGGKHIKPVQGSWVKGHKKAMAKPAPAKAPMKSKVGFVPKKSHAHKRTAKAVKSPTATKQVNRSLNRVARRPSPRITMKSIKPARKPPSRGR